MQIRIVGTQLPGRDCGAGDNFPGYPTSTWACSGTLATKSWISTGAMRPQ
jgi:hypothetical protein